MDKAYTPGQFEDKIYKTWEDSGAFTPEVDENKTPFVISMPPPNVTGTLHLGHATTMAIEDLMTRYHRMKGDAALWVPGTDHAGIATQTKVEKVIAEEGLTRHDLGREQFLKHVEEFVQDSKDTIHTQMRRMGASADWSRERYTLDEGLSHAVRRAFVDMYHDGLIYQGSRVVNWCTRCQSTLADDEVEYKTQTSKFYYLKYGPVIIGTARPETKFDDKVIIVHPDDERYTDYIGKSLTVPWITGDVEATFIADPVADMEMGSGAMTITPGHSMTDFDLAKKYDFEIKKIIDEDGKITSHGGPDFEGLEVKAAREKVVEELEKKGLVDRIDEKYTHNLSVCYRCETPIEPLPKKQWWLDVNKSFTLKDPTTLNYPNSEATLKELMIHVVKDGQIKILPDRFDKTYFHWIDNLRDWCLSRQIWWGHRIPVWYCDCGEIIVQEDESAPKCPSCQATNLTPDPDTLDTWFSSGLWTFSTLGWPDDTEELKYFHPTSVMETGYDILFFWVARMILMSTYHLNDIPFKTVYLHGMVRDKQGAKMSKSKGNGIDPLEMSDKFGTDAVRLSLVLGTSAGNDTKLYEEKIAGYRNFTNKVWNVSRFVIESMETRDLEINDEALKAAVDQGSVADQWIVSRYVELEQRVTTLIEDYRFSEAGTATYDFLWNEFADWYIEVSKIHPNKEVSYVILRNLLKLLHPFMPFVTEVLWKEMGEDDLLISAPWPSTSENLVHKEAESQFDLIRNLILKVRSIRSELNISPSEPLELYFTDTTLNDTLSPHKDVFKKMAKIGSLCFGDDPEGHAIHFVESGHEAALLIEGIVDIDAARSSIEKELKKTEGFLVGLEKKLSNTKFINNADPGIVAQEQARMAEVEEKVKMLKARLTDLGS